MEKSKKERTDRINWFLDFVQMDLKSLSPGDRVKLCYEAEEILFDRKLIEQEETFNPLIEEVRTFYDKLKKPSLQNLDEFFEVLRDRQGDLRGYILEFFAEIVKKKRPYFNAAIQAQLVVKTEEGIMTTSYLPSTVYIEGFAFGRFLNAVDGMPTYGFRKCTECKKIFFYPHKRKKEFCRVQCGWKFFARQRRESNPEVYKEYQREVMQNRYEKKIREKHPKAKIRKRRRRDQPGDEIAKK
jgi:hypothetical protein